MEITNPNYNTMPEQINQNTKDIAVLKNTVKTPATIYNATVEMAQDAGVINQSNITQQVTNTTNTFVLDTVGKLFRIVTVENDQVYVAYCASIRGPKGETGTPGTPGTPGDPLMSYPIGSIYITVSNSSPAELFGGQWEQLPANYALWTATSGAGETIAAGLPNITGEITFSNQFSPDDEPAVSGAINTVIGETEQYIEIMSATANRISGFSFDANKSNSIYGGNNTVQPPAYKIYAWKRVA